jgi:hypothetical protein
MAKAGAAFAAEHRGATQRTLAALEPMLSVLAPSAPPPDRP